MTTTVFLKSTRAPLAVGQAAVVEQLQQDVHDVRMRLFDFVEQHHGVRTPPNGFRELAGLVVAHISGRCSDEARYGVLSWGFDMSMRTIACSSSNRNSARARASSGFADTGRTEEQEAAERAIRVLQARPRTTDRVRHGDDGFFLTDDPQVQARFHLNQLLNLTFHQAADRNVRPLADDGGDVFFVDLFLSIRWPPPWASASSSSRICFSSCGILPHCSSDARA